MEGNPKTGKSTARSKVGMLSMMHNTFPYAQAAPKSPTHSLTAIPVMIHITNVACARSPGLIACAQTMMS